MTGSYSWYVGTLIDGKISHEIPVSTASWQSVMDDAGTFTITTALSDPQVSGLNLRTSAEPARCFLVCAYIDGDGNETMIDGGPIWSHSYDAASKVLTIRAAGLWSLWDHRVVLQVLAAGVDPATVSSTYSSLSLGTIAQRLIQLAQTHTGGNLPVVFAGDETGTNTRTYYGYDMTMVGDALRNLTAVQGGPEVQFLPQRNPADLTSIQWLMRTGTTEQPMLTQMGSDWIWDLSAVQSSASGLTVDRDGSAMADRAWVQGAGTDVSTLYGRADDTDSITAGFPLLEMVDTSHSGENGATVQATIDGYAAEDITLWNRPHETWTFTVQRDDTPPVGSYRVGDWVQLVITGDPYLPDGTYRSRITNLAGDTTNQVGVTLAPMIGAI